MVHGTHITLPQLSVGMATTFPHKFNHCVHSLFWMWQNNLEHIEAYYFLSPRKKRKTKTKTKKRYNSPGFSKLFCFELL